MTTAATKRGKPPTYLAFVTASLEGAIVFVELLELPVVEAEPVVAADAVTTAVATLVAVDFAASDALNALAALAALAETLGSVSLANCLQKVTIVWSSFPIVAFFAAQHC